MSYAGPSALIAAGSVLPALGIISVTLRFYIRKQQKLGFGLDDWFVLPALLFAIGVSITALYGVAVRNLGYPSHNFSVSSDNDEVKLSEQLEFAVFTMQAISLGFAKFSIIFFYRRIFNTGTSRGFDIFTKVLLVIVFGWSVSWVGAYVFACGKNVYYQWGSYNDQNNYCGRAVVKESFFVAADLVVDLILFIMPIPMIMPLRMSLFRRFGIILMFTVGTLTVVLSIIRVIMLSLLYRGQESALINVDSSSEISIWTFWTVLEVGVAVIVVCLPTFATWFHSTSSETVFRRVRGFVSILTVSTRSARRSSKSTGESSSKSSNDSSAGETLHDQENDRSTYRAKTEHYMQDPEKGVTYV